MSGLLNGPRKGIIFFVGLEIGTRSRPFPFSQHCCQISWLFSLSQGYTNKHLMDMNPTQTEQQQHVWKMEKLLLKGLLLFSNWLTVTQFHFPIGCWFGIQGYAEKWKTSSYSKRLYTRKVTNCSRRRGIFHMSFAGCQIPTSRGQILELWSRTSVEAARLENRPPYEEKNSSNQIHRRDWKLIKCGAKLFFPRKATKKRRKSMTCVILSPGWFENCSTLKVRSRRSKVPRKKFYTYSSNSANDAPTFSITLNFYPWQGRQIASPPNTESDNLFRRTARRSAREVVFSAGKSASPWNTPREVRFRFHRGGEEEKFSIRTFFARGATCWASRWRTLGKSALEPCAVVGRSFVCDFQKSNQLVGDV